LELRKRQDAFCLVTYIENHRVRRNGNDGAFTSFRPLDCVAPLEFRKNAAERFLPLGSGLRIPG